MCMFHCPVFVARLTPVLKKESSLSSFDPYDVTVPEFEMILKPAVINLSLIILHAFPATIM